MSALGPTQGIGVRCHRAPVAPVGTRQVPWTGDHVIGKQRRLLDYRYSVDLGYKVPCLLRVFGIAVALSERELVFEIRLTVRKSEFVQDVRRESGCELGHDEGR